MSILKKVSGKILAPDGFVGGKPRNFSIRLFQALPPLAFFYKTLAINNATIFTILIMGFMAGPAVSL